jgi:hypothetical protein
MQRHPFFAGIDWDRLPSMQPPYVPEVKDELDTQNFEHFDEEISPSGPTGGRRWGHVDYDFIGYTYKSFDAVRSSGDGTAEGGGARSLHPTVSQVQSSLESVALDS